MWLHRCCVQRGWLRGGRAVRLVAGGLIWDAPGWLMCSTNWWGQGWHLRLPDMGPGWILGGDRHFLRAPANMIRVLEWNWCLSNHSELHSIPCRWRTARVNKMIGRQNSPATQGTRMHMTFQAMPTSTASCRPACAVAPWISQGTTSLTSMSRSCLPNLYNLNESRFAAALYYSRQSHMSSCARFLSIGYSQYTADDPPAPGILVAAID